MNIKFNNGIAVIQTDGIIITDVQSALDLMATVRYQVDCDRIAIPKSAVNEDFFKLSTGLAGEILQKFVNYYVKLAIIGDYSGYTSKPLRDFIYECNKGDHVFFVETEWEALARLGSDVSIVPLPPESADDAAAIMCDVLSYPRSDAEASIRSMLEKPRTLLAAVEDNRVVGIIGAIPQYGTTGWELHPLAVSQDCQRRGVGTALVKALEAYVAERGGVMLYLGSDDETGTTSLYGMDLYTDTFGKIENIKNIGGHPYPFYEKHGFKIVGVLPDANGIGKPDIWMAKRIGR